MESPTTSWTYRRHAYCATRLMTVGILWAAILGCSQDGSSITPSALCMAPVVAPSGSMLGVVGPLTISAAGNGSSITLKWNVNGDTLGCRLYSGTRSQSYEQMADVGLLTTSVVSDLASNMTYYFVVTAYNAAGLSCPSNEVSAHVP